MASASTPLAGDGDGSDRHEAARTYIGVLERVLHAHRDILTASDIAALATGVAAFRKAADAARAAGTHGSTATQTTPASSIVLENFQERSMRASLELAKQAQAALRHELEAAKRAETLAIADNRHLMDMIQHLQQHVADAPALQAADAATGGMLNDEQKQALVRIKASTTALQAAAAPVAIMASGAASLATTATAIATSTKLANAALDELQSGLQSAAASSTVSD